MLPYHWPHPTWNHLPDHRAQSSSHHSQSPRWTEQPCCAGHSETIAHMQRKMNTMEVQLKSVLNYLADHGLSHPNGTPNLCHTPAALPLMPAADINRKRRPSSASGPDSHSQKCSTSMKRRKLIQDLEQQVAEEREDNLRMEKRIAEMRQLLSELRAKRHAITEHHLYKVGKEESDDDDEEEEDSDPDSADEDGSDLERDRDNDSDPKGEKDK